MLAVFIWDTNQYFLHNLYELLFRGVHSPLLYKLSNYNDIDKVTNYPVTIKLTNYPVTAKDKVGKKQCAS